MKYCHPVNHKEAYDYIQVGAYVYGKGMVMMKYTIKVISKGKKQEQGKARRPI